MALIRCPKCGAKISSKAVACPKCGTEASQFDAIRNDKSLKGGNSKKTILAVIITAISVLAIVSIVYFAFLKPKGSEGASFEDEYSAVLAEEVSPETDERAVESLEMEDIKETAEPESSLPMERFYEISEKRLLIEDDIARFSKSELRIIRNQLYARHGYIFKSQDLTDYFSQFDWYSPSSSDVTSKLSDIELKNVDFIKAHE